MIVDELQGRRLLISTFFGQVRNNCNIPQLCKNSLKSCTFISGMAALLATDYVLKECFFVELPKNAVQAIVIEISLAKEAHLVKLVIKSYDVIITHYIIQLILVMKFSAIQKHNSSLPLRLLSVDLSSSTNEFTLRKTGELTILSTLSSELRFTSTPREHILLVGKPDVENKMFVKYFDQ